MDYLRLFSTETEYDTSKSGFEYPTVSYVDSNDTVYYMEKPDYSKEYLTFEALESGTITLTIPTAIGVDKVNTVSYSVDNGETWTSVQNDNTQKIITTPSLNTGDKVLWKGVAVQYANITGSMSIFSSTCNVNVYGNIMSLLYGDNFSGETTLSNTYNFYYLFSNMSTLVSAKHLILPATQLTNSCYGTMFSGCTNLIDTPVLPATTLAGGCYMYMFQNCTSLTTASELPAETLVQNCYALMFEGCTSLTTAPELPATALASNCYSRMFYGCTSLTTAPELPATTLASNCYQNMFTNCSKLNYIKALFLTTPTTSYTQNWVSGVASTGTFVKNRSASWTTTGVNGVPTNWTVELYGDLR